MYAATRSKNKTFGSLIRPKSELYYRMISINSNSFFFCLSFKYTFLSTGLTC